MFVPSKFKEILETNQELAGIVYTTFAKFELIVKESKFEFFDEYTNHGIDHIENVLATAQWLITDETYNLLNAKDITILMLAILLHDLGMHISYEGFLELINGSAKDRQGIFEEDDLWANEWDKYLVEMKQWDDKRIIKVFGEKLNIRKPSLIRAELTGYDKSLIGEFIRRKHSRLAHEISIFGFPAFDGRYIPFATELPEYLRDLIGLVARSHGINVRETFNYLQKKYTRHSWKTPQDVKIIFLMVVLRISDYLHITPDRVNPTSLEIRKYTSPLSRVEREAHKSIESIHNNADDPELLYVHGNPKSSELFLKLKRLLNDIQSELDMAWAVLGEVYGNHKDFKNLMILLRRIQSNIDDKKNLQVNYLPEKVAFDSNPDLIKLLIAPLYGKNPTFGVRELIQNSIDACREREHYSENEDGVTENTNYKPEITISIEKNLSEGYSLFISDNGIGMTADTIVNYFFKAGASFRKSEAWSTKYLDKAGGSKILRSGRFGVGVLAAFLLGEQISVSTRFISDSCGWKFKCMIDSEQVEVEKIDRNVGTTVEIELSNEVAHSLKFDIECFENSFDLKPSDTAWFAWYRLNYPKITLQLPDNWVGVEEINNYIDSNIEGPSGYSFRPDRFQLVYWDFRAKRKELLCNGFLIPNWRGLSFKYNYPSFPVNPKVVVLDPDGILPLSLDRQSVDGELPFCDNLAKDICKDLLAKLFLLPEINLFESVSHNITTLSHPAFDRPYKNSYDLNWFEGELLLFNSGYTLPHSFFLEKLSVEKIVKVWLVNDKKFNLDFLPNFDSNICVSLCTDQIESATHLKPYIYPNVLELDKRFKINAKHFFITKEHSDFLFVDTERRIRKEFKMSININKTSEKWVEMSQGSLNPLLNTDFISENANSFNFVLITDLGTKIVSKRKFKNKDIFTELLEHYFTEDFLIPYNIEERKKKFPKLYIELEKYMFKYRNEITNQY